MQQPPGFAQQGSEGLVCKFQKSIYGLKQAARAWNSNLNETLLQAVFKRNYSDSCLYTKYKDGKWTYILSYVDDLLLAYVDKNDREKLVKHLSKQVGIKQLGDIKHYLGI